MTIKIDQKQSVEERNLILDKPILYRALMALILEVSNEIVEYLAKIINDELINTKKEAITQHNRRLKERINKVTRTMGHIEGDKRVDTDYVTIDDLLKILEEWEI